MMKKHLEDLLDNALGMYDEEVLKNIQLKKQYEIMKMNAEYLIEKNNELNKKNKEQEEEIERLNNIIKDIKSQLDYIETYSSKEDVFEDMKRRLNRIENIVNRK
jgi:predicted nuclease with TOPRIM domain